MDGQHYKFLDDAVKKHKIGMRRFWNRRCRSNQDILSTYTGGLESFGKDITLELYRDVVDGLVLEAQKMYSLEFLPLPVSINLLLTIYHNRIPFFNFPPSLDHEVELYLGRNPPVAPVTQYTKKMLEDLKTEWSLVRDYILGDGRLWKVLEERLKVLSERQVEVLKHRFGLYGENPKTRQETAQYIAEKEKRGYRRESVRDTEQRALRKLRHQISIITYLKEQRMKMFKRSHEEGKLPDYAEFLYGFYEDGIHEISTLKDEIRSLQDEIHRLEDEIISMITKQDPNLTLFSSVLKR